MHGLQFRVGSSVKALHLLFLQTFKEADGVFIYTPSFCQNQRCGPIVIALRRNQKYQKSKMIT